MFEEKGAKADSNRGPFAYQPNALPLGQTGSRMGANGFYSLTCVYSNIYPVLTRERQLAGVGHPVKTCVCVSLQLFRGSISIINLVESYILSVWDCLE